MIRSLLSAHGSNAAMVTVFIDGFYKEPAEVASLFGIRAIHVSSSVVGRRVGEEWGRVGEREGEWGRGRESGGKSGG